MTNYHINIFKKISGTFFVNIMEMGLRMILSIVLARTLGPSEYGIYTFAITVTLILSIVSLLGTEYLAIREVAHYVAKKKWATLNGLIKFCRQYVITASLIVSILSGIIAWLFALNTQKYAIIIACSLLPFVCFIRLHECLLRGLQHVVIALITNRILRPLLFIVFLVSFYLLGYRPISASSAMIAQLFVCIIVMMIAFLLFRNRVPTETLNSVYEYERNRWINSMKSFFFIGILWTVTNNVNVIMLNLLASPTDIGLYNVSKRGSELVCLGLLASNVAFGPMVSYLYAENNMKKLQKLLQLSATLTLVFGVIVALVLIIYNEEFLSWIFGIQFVPAAQALTILSFGQLLSIATGPVENVLNMTGFEKDTLHIAIAALCLNIILDLFLIPRWGLNGVAVATAITLVLWNSTMMYFVYRRTGLGTTIFGGYLY